MRFLALLLALLSLPAKAADVYPENIHMPVVSPTDQQRLDQAVKLVCQSPGNTLHLETRQWKWNKTLEMKSADGSYCCGEKVVMGLWWRAGVFTGTGPAIRCTNLKQCRFENVGIFADDASATGIQFVSTESSSEVVIESARLQGFKAGLDFSAPNGADMSVFHIVDTSFVDCEKGIRVVGSNALDFDIDNPRGTNIGALVDLRQGGAGSVVSHPGGSYCKRLVWANGGYPLTITDVTSEWNKECVIEIGGEGDSECDAGGFAQNNQVSVSFLDNRSMTGDLLRIGCDASVSTGFNTGRVFARSESRTGSLKILGHAPVATQGKWNVVAEAVK